MQLWRQLIRTDPQLEYLSIIVLLFFKSKSTSLLAKSVGGPKKKNLVWIWLFLQCIQAYVTCNLILQNPLTSHFWLKFGAQFPRLCISRGRGGLEKPQPNCPYCFLVLCCWFSMFKIQIQFDQRHDQGHLPVPLVPAQACHQLTRGHCSSTRDLHCWSWSLTWPGCCHCRSCSCRTQSCSGPGWDCRSWCRSLKPHMACSETGWC